MNSPRKRKPGGGRKPAAGRKVNRSRSFYLYEDQVSNPKVTPDLVRKAVDYAISTQRFDFGPDDYLEVYAEMHHPYGMAIVRGEKASKIWSSMQLMPYDETIEVLNRIINESRPE